MNSKFDSHSITSSSTSLIMGEERRCPEDTEYVFMTSIGENGSCNDPEQTNSTEAPQMIKNIYSLSIPQQFILNTTHNEEITKFYSLFLQNKELDISKKQAQVDEIMPKDGSLVLISEKDFHDNSALTSDYNSEMLHMERCENPEHGFVESPITHIEIIKSKPCASRRVTGANRVVPLITNMWQSSELRTIELNLQLIYRTILEDPGNKDDRQCQECNLEMLSATQLEHHLRKVHHYEQVAPEQCFVCRKKYASHLQLKHHLSQVHRIQYPEMICKICFMEFTTAMEKKAHERKHDKIYTCQFCPSKFASEYFCQKHYNQHLIYLKPFECNKCGKRFRNALSLSIHSQRHVDVKCYACKIIFMDDITLLMHLKDHETSETEKFLNAIKVIDEEENHLEELLDLYLKQPLAKKSDESSIDIVSACVKDILFSVSCCNESESQGVSSREIEGFECKLCGVKMESANNLVDHRRKFHLRNRTCPFCGRRSQSVSQTWRHIATHVKEKSLKTTQNCKISDKMERNNGDELSGIELTCNVCHKVLPSRGKLNSHLEAVHKIETIIRPYSCSICPRKFQNKGASERHLLVHSKDKSGCWKCVVCSQAFLRPKFLLKHITEHETRHQCHICCKVFPKSSKLKIHVKSHEMRYKCDKCSVCCSTLSGLRVHLRTHTGERPYSCDHCDKRFKRLQALKKHVSQVHRKKDCVVHPCCKCSLEFLNRSNLLRHFLVCHQGQRRFVCGLCGVKFGQNQDLRRHLKVKHQFESPNISSSDKKAVNEIYVFPGIEGLSNSHSHVAKIKAIVAEEKLKFQGVEELLNRGTRTLMGTPASQLAEPRSGSAGQSATVAVSSPSRPSITSTNPPPTSINAECSTETTYLNKVPPDMLTTSKTLNLDANDVKKLKEKPHCGTSYLVEHVETESEPVVKLVACEICMKVFLKEEEYSTHVKERSPCAECGNMFCDQDALQHHIEAQHVITVYRCGICLEDFTESNALTLHMNNVHLPRVDSLKSVVKESTTLCMQTSKEATQNKDNTPSSNNSSEALLQSIQSSANYSFVNNILPVISGTDFLLSNLVFQPTPTLQTLPIAFTNQSLLATTPVLTFQGTNQTISSEMQSATVLPFNDLGSFALVDVQPSKPILHSNITDLATNDPVNLENTQSQTKHADDAALPRSHNMSLRHSVGTKQNLEKDELTCKECNKKFTLLTTLGRHYKTHRDIKPHRCLQCGKCFTEKFNLKVHMRVHTGERPYVCEKCGKQMRYQKEYADHKKMHLGELPFECEKCGRRFLRQRVLIRHTLTHTKKSFECPICSKAFTRKDQLLLHVRIHTNLTFKSYPCNICDKAFKSKSKLNQHQILHTGKKNHLCTICNKTFAQRAYLKLHLKTHEKRSNYVQCAQCMRRFAFTSLFNAHVEKCNAKQHKQANPIKCSKATNDILTEVPEEDNNIAYVAAQLETPNMEVQEVDLLDSENILGTDKCNTVIFLEMIADELNFK